MSESKELEISPEALLEKALDCERQAEEMKKMGDQAAAHALKGMAEAYFLEAAERE